ncbi:hypothetical protein [Jiangella endophytica]|uniref:hypothetical protein n=1 Tax=Jiangella endophytica TaxID=1623398 RepID=UPI000E344490|nr:hypothetical protein [Jiangella endophytica]
MAEPQRSNLYETIIYEGEAAEARLWQLCRARSEAFARAALRGHERRRQLLPVHPLTYHGQVVWGETIAALRQQLLSLQTGWEIDRSLGYETSHNPQLNVDIAVVGGDVFTGVHGFRHPRTNRPRGPVSHKRVEHNRAQLALDISGLRPEDIQDAELAETWFFLMHGRDDVLYSEISSPMDLGLHRRVSQWGERILLPPQPMVGAVTPIPSDQEPDEGAIVRVGRKA